MCSRDQWLIERRGEVMERKTGEDAKKSKKLEKCKQNWKKNI